MRRGGEAYSCRDLGVEFHSEREPRRVLEDLNFSVGDGEFVSLVGGSGIGKTTLLRVLAGLFPAAPGSSVLYHGHPVAAPPDGVVMVFQDYTASLLPWRTVARNVRLGLEGRRSRPELGGLVEEALRAVGLQDHAGDYPRQLSGGMQQRVQIARALVMQASTILMDEPFGSLDAMTKAGLQDQLLQLRDETQPTIVFVTHDIDEAIYLSDRVIVLVGRPGRIGHVVNVDLPRPRDQLLTKEEPRYLELRHELFEAIGRVG